VGEGGYQVGKFPPLWSEWNGKYRDTVRDFWRGEHATLPEFAARFTGSGDLYASEGRHPVASVNFATCHDGFTLADLVSYNTKHNEANGEGGRDGTDDNRSWNCGAEGPADDPAVLALRQRQACNFLATLLLSQGVPMLAAGDEMSRSQRGNNNAYCQDNEISWVHWPPAALGQSATRNGGARQGGTAQGGAGASGEGAQGVLAPGTAEVLLDFTQRLIQLRRDHPVLRRRRYLQGRPARGADDQLGDVAWFTPGGEEMTGQDWDAGFAQSLTVFLNGGAITETDRRGQPIRDDSFLLLFNASPDELTFALPPAGYGESWETVLDTARPAERFEDMAKAGELVPVRDRSLQVLRRG